LTPTTTPDRSVSFACFTVLPLELDFFKLASQMAGLSNFFTNLSILRFDMDLNKQSLFLKTFLKILFTIILATKIKKKLQSSQKMILKASKRNIQKLVKFILEK